MPKRSTRAATSRSKPRQSPADQLAALAHHVVVPEGAVSTAWPRISRAVSALGVTFDPWQDLVGRLAFAKRADGLYAAGIGGVCLSIPRQVGKTFFVSWAILGLCLVEPGITVIWTAHHSRTSNEVFEAMRTLADSAVVKGHIDRVLAGAGNQQVVFNNGSRILFGARESGFGRGFSGVDVIVFDEAQILGERAIDDMTAAQNAAPNALAFLIGTPPKPTDPSEAFTRARTDALNGDTKDTLWVEFSAERGDDRDQQKTWRKANPSFPHRTSQAAMLRMRRRMTDAAFDRESLGIWDELPGKQAAAISPAAWADRAIKNVPASWPLAAIGLDMSPDRTRVTVAMAAWSPDGIHVELADATNDLDEQTSRQLVEHLWKIAKRRIPVVMDGFSPARALEGPMRQKGMKVRALSAGELAQATGAFQSAVEVDGSITHFDQPALNDSLRDTIAKPFGPGGAWKPIRRDVGTDLTAALAAMCAHLGALKWGRRPAHVPDTDTGTDTPADTGTTTKEVADWL